MRILVAGATGVLGRPVVRLLKARGHEVRGLARSAGNEETLRLAGAEPVRANLFDPPSLEAAARGCEAVLHLATSIPVRRRPRAEDFSLNDRMRTEGTRNLLAAALAARARRYVQQSVALFHHSAGEEWVDEEAPLADHPLAQSSLEMERLVWQSHGLDGLSTVILRGGVFYGPDAAHTRQLFSALRAGLMPMAGDGENYWSLVHTEDMASAVVTATEAPLATRVYLVVDDEPVKLRVLFAHVARAQGGPRPRRWPAWLVALLAGRLALDSLRASFRCLNVRLKKDLGWRPAYPTYREGVQAVLGAWASRSAPS